jgi:pimeloyl-ACP methyl ester carboxylesterase/membrane protein DedA with SNARE-associated domain
MARSADADDAPSGGSRRRRLGRWLLAVYLLLLLLSHLVQSTTPDREPLPPDLDAVEVPEWDGDHRLDETVRLAYRRWEPEGEPDAPTVLLIHGSPGAGSNFDRLGPLLADHFRVLAPDLPGFGHSDRDLPDYSIRAHAHYLVDFLRELDLESVHVVGYSLGGAVALELYDLAPERVRSLVLLSATGVQELELLGQYHLNHAVHALQLGALWLLHEAVPHFGLLDDSLFSLPYARNFYDTDQRPLRGILERFRPPMLVIHGEDDVLVPLAAAREHHRLVPQSELVVTDANHFMVFLSPERLDGPITDFVERVEAGTAPTRAEADPERVREAREGRPEHAEISGLALVLMLVLIALATLASEDLTCIAAGLLVARGTLGFLAAAGACSAGIYFGDLMLYGLGRLGRPWLGRAPLRWFVSPRDVARSSRWFQERGPVVILLSRFLPGMRIPTYVGAGLLQTRFTWFAFHLFIPVALWTPLLVGVAWAFGERIFDTFELFQRYALPGFAALLIVVWLVVGLGRKLVTHRGRRLLLGSWRRKVRWEFWPPWAFYPPVVLHLLRLSIRHRGATVFTAANPGMPAGGGFIGESKSEILGCLDPSGVARYRKIPGHLDPTAKAEEVRAFQDEHGLGYPVVVKPDLGQRGSGVSVVKKEGELEAAFRHAGGGDLVVQEYVPGVELGIFYVRRPGEEKGWIFSITQKVLPTVTGDGQRTLEQLILDDDRAVAMAETYFDRLEERLDEVPAAGEEVRLVELGTHCRGAIFLDGAEYRTPELEAAVDRFARSYEGFYFGRFDFRAPTLRAFEEGRDLRAIELNGTTSEATHVYDPKNTLRDAYRVLFEQWRLAYEIGAANRDRGVRPASVRELIGMVVSFRRGRAGSAGG